MSTARLAVVIQMPYVMKHGNDSREGTYLSKYNEVIAHSRIDYPNPASPPVLDFDLPGNWREIKHDVENDGYTHSYVYEGSADKVDELWKKLEEFYENRKYLNEIETLWIDNITSYSGGRRAKTRRAKTRRAKTRRAKTRRV